MTWGDPKALPACTRRRPPTAARTAYEEEKLALEVSLEAGVNLFDTAAIYSLGASERRLGELARGKDVLIATKFPGGFFLQGGRLAQRA